MELSIGRCIFQDESSVLLLLTFRIQEERFAAITFGKASRKTQPSIPRLGVSADPNHVMEATRTGGNPEIQHRT